MAKSDRVIVGSKVRLSRRMPHEWKYVVTRVVSSLCQVTITTTVAGGVADGDS